MEKWVTKKNIVLFLGAIAIVFLFLKLDIAIQYCLSEHLQCSFTRALLLPFAISFPISLMLLFFDNRIFRSWVNQISVLIAISWLLSLFGKNSHGMFSLGAYGYAVLVASIIVCMSFLFISIKSWELKALDRGTPVNLWLKWFLFALAFVVSIALSIFLYGFVQ